MADNKVTVEFEVVSNAAKKLDDIAGSLKDLQGAAETGFKKSSQAFAVFEGVLTAELALRAIDGLISASKKLFNTFVVDGVKAAQEQEVAINDLNSALARTGQFSQESSKDLQAFAAGLQEVTTVSDEAILSSAALIQNIAKLGTEDLKRATQGALDLSAALGIDLESASRLVAKAAEGNISALERQGIEIRKGNTDAETFANTLAALANLEGAAEAKTRTYAGAVLQLQNNFNEIQEAVGNVIVKNEVVIALINEISAVFANAAKNISDNQAEYKKLVAEAIIVAIEATGLFIASLTELIVIGRQAGAQLEGLGKAFLAPSEAFGALLRLDFGALGDAFKKPGIELDAALTKAAENPALEKLLIEIVNLKIRIQQVADAAGDFGNKSEQGFGKAGKAAAKLTEEEDKLLASVIKLREEQEKDDPEALYKRQSEALVKALEADRITKDQFDALDFAAFEASQERRKAINEKAIDDLIDRNQTLRDQDRESYSDANADEIAANQAKLDALAAQENVSYDKKEKKRQADLAQQKVLSKAQQADIDQLASYQTSKIGAVNAIGKAAAIANTTIKTYEGATSAGASLAGIPIIGPALAIAAQAAFIASGLENVARIASTPLAGGINSVPGVGTQDNFPAVLAPGERVVPAKSNQDLTAFLQDQGGQSVLLQAIVDRLDRLQNQIIVNVGGREIVNELRDASLSGRTIEAA